MTGRERAFPSLNCQERIASSLRVTLVSSINTSRHRWTVDVYWRSCFKTNIDEIAGVYEQLPAPDVCRGLERVEQASPRLRRPGKTVNKTVNAR